MHVWCEAPRSILVARPFCLVLFLSSLLQFFLHLLFLFLFLCCHSCSLWHHSLCSCSALLFILLLVGLLSIILHLSFAHSCWTFSCLKLLFFLFNVVAYSLAWSYCFFYSMLLHILLLEVIVFLIWCCCIFSCSKLLFFLFNVVSHSLARSYCSSYSTLFHVFVSSIRLRFLFIHLLNVTIHPFA